MMTNEMQTAYNYIIGNKIICDFLITEARKQVAADINKIDGKCATEKAVELFLMNGNDKSVQERFGKYLAAGTAACVAMRMEATAA